MGSSDLHAESIDHSRFIGAKSQGLEERLLSPEAWWSRGLDLSGQGGVKESSEWLLREGTLAMDPESERGRLVGSEGQAQELITWQAYEVEELASRVCGVRLLASKARGREDS